MGRDTCSIVRQAFPLLTARNVDTVFVTCLHENQYFFSLFKVCKTADYQHTWYSDVVLLALDLQVNLV